MILKEKVFHAIEGVLNVIDSFSYIKTETNNSRLSEVLFTEEVKYEINLLKEEVISLKNKMEWDTYNIGLFGITNAGKSTIIETLIKGSGKSIGIGEKDFTKESTKNPIPDFPHINIVDMPGIEGDEQPLKDTIKKAIIQCHTLFCVIGTTKAYEEGTIQKIKTYIEGQGEIYVIINERYKPDAYKNTKSLDNKLLEEITQQFEMTFNNQFKGCLNFNAHLAFCLNGNLIEERHIKEREKYIKILGNPTEAYKISNFLCLKNTIAEGYNMAEQKIAKANISKVFYVIEKIIYLLEKRNEEVRKELIFQKNEVETAIIKFNHLVENCKKDIKITVKNELDSFKDSLLKDIYEGIDKGFTSKQIEETINNKTNTFNKVIQSKIELLLNDLKIQIPQLFEELKSRLNLSVSLNKTSININIEAIIQKLNITTKYILKKIIEGAIRVGIVISSFLIGNVLGVIALVISLIDFLVNLFQDKGARKVHAKKDSYSKVEELTSKIKSKIDKKLTYELDNLSKDITKELNLISDSFKEIDIQLAELNTDINQIKNIYSNIKNLTL